MSDNSGTVKITISVFGRQTEEETCKVFFTDKARAKYVIPIAELKRLCRKFSISEPQFIRESVVKDRNYSSHSKASEINRFTALYKTSVGNQDFYGEGSAGGDNVTSEYASYAYEISHKRAKARCIKNALGICDVITEIEAYIPEITDEEYERLSKVAEESGFIPANDIQKNAIFDSICRHLGVTIDSAITSQDVLSVFLKTLIDTNEQLYRKICTMLESVDDSFAIVRAGAVKLFGELSVEESGEILMICGDFSNGTTKPNKSI